MTFRTTIFSLAAAGLWTSANGYVWPDPKTDVLEGLLYQQVGFRSNGIIALLGTGDGKTFHCRGLPFVKTGQSLGAEWIRNAYHDMATHDSVAGTGGMDASIALEMGRPENVGSAFLETTTNTLVELSTRASAADLFALAAVLAIGVCSNGTVVVPLTAGRIDATEAGPFGVPQPQEGLDSHIASFSKQGFNVTEMIGLVACGHSVGGVHGVDFPEVVTIVNDTRADDNTIGFDSTANFFDNHVATEFVSNTSQNPLAFGHNETTRSDFRIFNADGGALISHMAESSDFFLSTCKSLFERMLNTVPHNVVLSDPIAPVPVKPVAVTVDIDANGNMTISGAIRFIRSLLPSSAQVLIRFTSREGSDCSEASCPIISATTNSNLESRCAYPNCGPELKSYSFTATIPAVTGISSFVVEVIDTASGESIIYDNAGHKFPLPDNILPSLSRSCVYSARSHMVTAMVLAAERFTNISLVVPERYPADSFLPSWVPTTIPMSNIGPILGTNYTLFTADYNFPSGMKGNAHPYDLIAAGTGVTIESTFNEFSATSPCSQ